MYVRNELFRMKIRDQYYETSLKSKTPDIFKIVNNKNPLKKLLELDEKSEHQSLIVIDLIEIVCKQIKITNDDIMEAILKKPTRHTLIYVNLFNKTFQATSIRETIINNLKQIWSNWQMNDCQMNEVKIWNRLNSEKKSIVFDIWTQFGEIIGKTISFESFISKSSIKVEAILKVENDVRLCIPYYCKNASDFEVYMKLISKLNEENSDDSARKLELPEQFHDIEEYVDDLSKPIESITWEIFLEEYLNNTDQQKTCLQILFTACNIFQIFKKELEQISTNQDQPPISQLQKRFPEKQYVDDELEIFRSFLDEQTLARLKILLIYWKNRDDIIHFSKGCTNLCAKYNIIDERSIEMCNINYKNYLTQYLDKYSNTIRDIIIYWDLSSELIEYLYTFTATDIDHLLETVNDWDETSINTKTVLDFAMITRLILTLEKKIQSISSKDQSLTLAHIVDILKELTNEYEITNVLSSFDSCSKNLQTIQRVYTESKNKEQSKKTRILNIVDDAQFCFCIHQSNYQFDVHITNMDWEPITFVDLNDLRDRARLIQYAQDNGNDLQTYTAKDIKQLEVFIDLIDVIEEILQNFRSLYVSGYPVVKQYPMNRRRFACQKGNYDELKQFKNDLVNELKQWEKELCEKYKTCLNLTYLSYKQLSTVEHAIRKRTFTKSTDLTYHLLRFMNVDPQSIEPDASKSISTNPLDLLENLAPVLKSKYDDPICRLTENENINKIFLIETTNSGIPRAVMSLFDLNNISPPVANQLFYCTNSTTWTEIRAFVYRCFYSQTLHQLIRPELLSIVIQEQFVQLLIELTEQTPKHLFRLGFITTVPSLHLYLSNSLKTRRTIQIIRDQDLLNEETFREIIRKLIHNQCTLVTSKVSGLGKSTYIKKQIQKHQKQLFKFSIYGDMNIETLIERLRHPRIQSEPSSIALHINIGPVENVEQLNEFLYSLIIFRCFRFNQMPIHVSSDTPIFIELDSSLHLNYLQNTIVLFKYIETYNIDSMDWNELNEYLPIIQFVSNYLRSIDDRTIDTKEINGQPTHILDKSTCIISLKKDFLSNKNFKLTSWTQLSILISIYYTLFDNFSQSDYFAINHSEKSTTLRSDILKSLLKLADRFLPKNVNTENTNSLFQWDKNQSFAVFFTNSYKPLFVYKTITNLPSSLKDRIYQSDKNILQKTFSTLLKKHAAENQSPDVSFDLTQFTHNQFFCQLASLSAKYTLHKSLCLTCFKQYDYNDYECLICPEGTCLIRQDSSNFEEIVAAKLEQEYILTADNCIKMLFIYLRTKSNLPVLIMGETGCGKTSLIQFLCRRILDDEMITFHVHAGVTSEQIIDRMHEYIQKARKTIPKRLWIFFDEFNTTPNIGLIKEIVCERTLLGEPLPNNMVFLGACNPQRRINNSNEDIGVKKYHSEMQRDVHGETTPLLYSVVPIPETMLEHIWDYGHLDPNTEKTYIATMLNTYCLHQENVDWLKCMVKLVSESQNYIRAHDDVSSVSLRDVSRFRRFYFWFSRSLNLIDSKKMTIDEHGFNPVERASLLALFLCYYFRLNTSTERTKYLNMISKSIKECYPNKSLVNLDQMLHSEKMKLIGRMELPAGTAKNRALTDNIFVLYNCIFNRIPVILCGNPGCSKTSAVQIVISNMRGKTSKNEFFRKQEELIAVSYQGSQNCTSESIIKVFERADRYANKNKQTTAELLPVIVFDEIGLAELSPHNPLKVLHSELEVEQCRHGFVGLSNWRLDASKMNRAVYLACPEPDLDDLETTATSLSESMASKAEQENPLSQTAIHALAYVYLDTCDYMKKERNQQYFGLRDYYSLIKGIVRDLLETGDDLFQIVRQQLSRNFDDDIVGLDFMWTDFCKRMRQEDQISQYSHPNFVELLDHSLSSRTGRFLMLIGDNESTFDYVQRYINNKYASIQTKTLIGSTLPGDFLSTTTYTEQYNTRVLMDTILYAEKDITLFLRGLGHLYDNLYDLFNQSYAVSADKKYCRIALGSLYHPRCLVNDKFYCVVFVKREDLYKYDAPFLNRFEKHRIDTNRLADARHRSVVSILIKWMNGLLSPNSTKDLFLWSRSDYIRSLVTEAFDYFDSLSDSPGDQQVLNYCQTQILRISSFDLPLVVSLNTQIDNRKEIIEQYYQIHKNLSLSSLIQQEFEENKKTRLLIYTYSQIYQTIDFNNHTNYEIVQLNEFRTELDLLKKLKMHNLKESKSLLCIRIDYHHDQTHIPMLKYALLNVQVNDVGHGVCLIFHLQRCQLKQASNTVFFDGWLRVMIDDLQTHELLPEEMLLNSSYSQIIHHLKFFEMDERYNELVNGCLIKLHYSVTNRDDEKKINDRRNTIINLFTNEQNNLSLNSILKKHLIEIVQKRVDSQDWRQDLLTNGIVTTSSRSFNEALVKTIVNYLETDLSTLLFQLENYSLIDSFLFLNRTTEKIKTKLFPIWSYCWDLATKTIDTSNNSNSISLVFDLHLPCAAMEYEIINQIRQNTAQIAENVIESGYKQLINTSIYSKFINDILEDNDLFAEYFHDQLTLTRNEGNIRHLSTSFIQNLLTFQLSNTPQDRLQHLFVNYKELFEIMKLFEISLPFFQDENKLSEILTRQLIIDNDAEEMLSQTDTNLYRLIVNKSGSFLILPEETHLSDEAFQTQTDPFIDTCLMNLIELLVSLSTIQSGTSFEQLINTYNLFVQSVTRLTAYEYDEIKNIPKLTCILRLATCISSFVPAEQALQIFQQGDDYFSSNHLYDSREQITKVMNHFKTVIGQESTDKRIKLLKLENELVTNWFVDNEDKHTDVLEFINELHKDLWAYSGRIFDLLDRSLDLPMKIKSTNGKISNDKYDSINQFLNRLNDPTRKMEILFSTRNYIQLVLSDTDISSFQNEEMISKELKSRKRWSAFEDYLKTYNEHNLGFLSRLIWLRYFLLYYIHALKYDIKEGESVNKINDILVKNSSPFCSTIKLYIIKQLCQCMNMSYHDLCERFKDRNLTWIGTMINQQSVVILPLPLFELEKEFRSIHDKLSNSIDVDQMKDLVGQCSKNQNSAYCFLMWFIHHYTRFYFNNVNPNEQLLTILIESGISNRFDSIGYQFISLLCINFSENSFFRLSRSMSEDDLHRRLVILNIIALLISFKFNRTGSLFRSFLFDNNGQMPKKYSEHFKNLYHLTGFARANDPALQQMMYINAQNNNNKQHVFRCSSECSWLFFIENSAISDEHRQCPLCKRETSITQNGDAIVMNHPHISMNPIETSQFITQYTEKQQNTNSNNFKQPISHHLLSLIINSMFVFLHELDYLPGHTSVIEDYFTKTIEKHYTSILPGRRQSYFWLYKIFNHILDQQLVIDRNFTKFEEHLVLPHIKSVTKEIRDYKLHYFDYLSESEKSNKLFGFVEELIEDDQQYPLLQFFNVTNIHSINIIQHFHNELQLQPDFLKTYPLTTFLLKRISEYDRIPHLYSIIKFTNYLIQNFNYRIDRENANNTKISQFLKDHPELNPIYKDFEKHWFAINKYEYDFANKTSIATFLLNTSSANQILIPIANLQNEIVDYFHSQDIRISLQSIHQKHLFNFSTNEIRKLLVEKCMIINYEYGMSEEIFYDFDEVEWTLRNEISCLPRIDVNNIRYFNYQFELYDENMSLINDIRKRFPQKLFEQQERFKIREHIDSSDNNSCLEISGSLEYILRYLQNMNNQNLIENLTIENFINEYIHSKSCIDDKLQRGLLGSVYLTYIIDLYEINEEYIFEKILSRNIRQELAETNFSIQERMRITGEFIETTYQLADSLKDFNVWISMFKRLLVRLLLSKMNLNFDSSLYDYILRSDMWKANVTIEDIQAIAIKDNIRLKHAFVLLKGLENQIKEQKSNEVQTKTISSDSSSDDEDQTLAAQASNVARSRMGNQRNNLRARLRQRRS